ncbi:uncharacterized protein [Nicotiana tomentosiformis]|uniref:Uncharacterized protein n=1 Tax=Nicotiana tabacum TaxID=4097 RepID=A0A1S4D7B5_TOBAC|nr:uncharacterized protein LOC104107090 [Nicotiana tomentosiformis]XP_016509233.1 PREDICTED: uncharacterized protein LOC107826727 [Nicotiana tabacum]
MCPLRIILIFLSATLAGFFVLRNLKSQPNVDPDDDDAGAGADDSHGDLSRDSNSLPLSSQVCSAIGKGFWTCVDMASGKYLWRHLVSSSPSPSNLKRNHSD